MEKDLKTVYETILCELLIDLSTLGYGFTQEIDAEKVKELMAAYFVVIGETIGEKEDED